jgi:hypothetical protein
MLNRVVKLAIVAMTKAIKSPNREFYRIDYICSMTGLTNSGLLLTVIMLLSAKLTLAQADGGKSDQCELLRKKEMSQPIRKAYKMPVYPGGDEKMRKFIKENFRHSKTQPKKGTVFIAVIINPDGSISGERLLKGINGEYNREALRVVRMMPKWTPGECEGGVKVAVEVLIEVKV